MYANYYYAIHIKFIYSFESSPFHYIHVFFLLDPRVTCLRRKSSSFSSIVSEQLLEENQISESIFYPRMSDRRKSSLERLESLEMPIRENIALKTVSFKIDFCNIFNLMW